jgi:nitrogen fixation protein NifQ
LILYGLRGSGLTAISAWHTGFSGRFAHPLLPAMTHPRATRAELLAASADPRSPDTVLFATLLAAHDETGLSQEQLALLYDRHFRAMPVQRLGVLIRSEEQAGFVKALSAFLLSHAAESVDLADAECLASIIAHACLRPDHLWRDLGLNGRDEVTDMLSRYFPVLVARNVDGMRWKKFLARELALSLGLAPRPAPGCPGCEDFAYCFGDKA